MNEHQPPKNAFDSPSVATKQRLGNRAVSPSRSDASSSVYSKTSRRSLSMIASTEDVEIFDQMSASTGVSISKKKKAKPNPSGKGFLNCEMYESSASGTIMDELVGGAVNHMHSFGSSSASQTANLDLRNNDNSFHVLASLLVEFFQAKVVGQTLTLLPEDRDAIERLLPESARLPFINAVRYRLELTPMIAVTPIQFLTLQCQELGLDKETTEENPILAVASLQNDPIALPVLTVLSSKSYLSSARQEPESRVTVDTTAEEQLVRDIKSAVDGEDEDEVDDEDFALARSRTEDDDGSKPDSDKSEDFVVDMKVSSSSSSSDESIIKIASSQDVADAMRAEEEDDNDTEDAYETEVRSFPSDDDSMPTDGEDPEEHETEVSHTAEEGDNDTLSDGGEDGKLEIGQSETGDEPEAEPTEINASPSANVALDVNPSKNKGADLPSETKKNVADSPAGKKSCDVPGKSSSISVVASEAPKKSTASTAEPEKKRQLEAPYEQAEATNRLPEVECERELAFDEKVDMEIYKAKMAAEDLANRMSIAAGLFVSDVRSAVETQVNNIQGNIQLRPLSNSFESQPANQHPPHNFISDIRSAVATQVNNIQNSISPRQQEVPNEPEEHKELPMTAEAIRDREILAFDISKFQSIDNVAVKQLLSELREASTMMAQSETQETTSFWREHVLSLQARLEAQFEELPTFDRIRAQLTPSTPPNEMPPVAPGMTSFSRETEKKEVHAPPPPSKKVPSPVETKPQTWDQTQAGTSPKQPDYDVPMVDVVAPADLPAGYQFEAEIEGQRFLAIVPKGGVQQGETFTCYMRELDAVAIDIPVGYWKDGLCNAFRYGCCHAVVCNVLFCPLIALGQIQTRINLDFLGRPRFGTSALSNRFMMMSVVVFWALTNIGIFVGCNIKWSQGMELSLADLCAFILINIAMLFFIVFVTQSTRSSLREKFLIQEDRCSDLEDVCCASVCLPCTICQMSRHTANYDDYEAVCCSKTGLPDGVRVNQAPTKESDGYVV